MNLKKQNNFIKKSNEIHKGKYDYSKVEYINSKTKVCIICLEHGEFWQQPSEHLKGFGCKLCSDNNRRKTNEQFIKDAKKIHGEKYDYSKVEYKNNKTKVCIICPEHGEFWQSPCKHLKGQGCKRCKRKKSKKITMQEFIDRCNLLYNKKYDYSKVKFSKLSDIITIICPIHGEFQQKASYHLYGFSCRKCANEQLLKSKELFISEAIKKHNNKYDYSKFEYVNSYTKSIIICPEHGEFLMSPESHIGIYGKGCPKCGHKMPLTNKEWTDKATKLHNNFFDYSKTNYINDKTEITITCPIHGDFKCYPNRHLYSISGCQKCASDKNISETKLYNLLNVMLPEFEFKRNCFNIIPKQELDIYSEKYKIAVEYQGSQHFKAIDFFGGKERFKYQVERDMNKIKLCKENGIKLFHFTFDKNIPSNFNLYFIYKNEKKLIDDIKKMIG